MGSSDTLLNMWFVINVVIKGKRMHYAAKNVTRLHKPLG